MDSKLVEKSKTISYALRHRPEAFGLKLDREGWVGLDELVSAVNRHEPSLALTRDDIDDIMRQSDKRRLEVDGSRIRATYGHSTSSRIEFEPSKPPLVLYHGTAKRFVDRILNEGLKPMSRQYVHLSSDAKTAVKVGHRHGGETDILVVHSELMWKDGFKFYHSANDGTWLCDCVPPKYLNIVRRDLQCLLVAERR